MSLLSRLLGYSDPPTYGPPTDMSPILVPVRMRRLSATEFEFSFMVKVWVGYGNRTAKAVEFGGNWWLLIGGEMNHDKTWPDATIDFQGCGIMSDQDTLHVRIRT